MIIGELTFNNSVEIPLYSDEFLGFRDFIMFSTSLVDMCLR